MLGQSPAPLVSGGRDRRRVNSWYVFVTLGLLIGGVTTTIIASVLSRVVGLSAVEREVRVAVLIIVVALMMAFDVDAIMRARNLRLTLNRQTSQLMKYSRNRSGVALYWGFDIGSGVSTIRATSAIWVVVAGSFLGFGPPYAGLFYGAGLAVAILVLSFSRFRSKAFDERIGQVIASRKAFQVINSVLGTIIVAWATFVLL